MGLEDLEVLMGLKSPAAFDRINSYKGFKVYRGWLVYEGGELHHIVTLNGQPLDPCPGRRAIDYACHFDWGYDGAGSAQLALAVLLEHFEGDAGRAVEVHRNFLANVVAKLPRGGQWTFSTHYVERMLEQVGRA